MGVELERGKGVMEGRGRCGVLTVSDRCSRGEAQDTSGPNLKQLLSQAKSLNVTEEDVLTACVPDTLEEIQRIILQWSDEQHLALILTTGGTGFSSRDVTPEATRPLLDREAPGLTVAMISKSLSVTPMAMLSRPVCGIRKSTLIVNLPGSKKASQECFEFILPALPHALDLLSGSSAKVAATHMQMTGSHVCPHGHTKPTPTGRRTRANFEQVALRPRHSSFPMLPVEEAMETVLRHTPSMPTIEVSSLQEARGCVIAEDVHAQQPLPPFPASVKDGYAVIGMDGPGDRNVLPPVAAGEMPSVTVVSGHVSRITTGAPLPPGADAVVQVEDTELLERSEDGCEEKRVRILSTVKAGNDVSMQKRSMLQVIKNWSRGRPGNKAKQIGFDIAKGEQVLSEGERLGPSELGLLAAVGVTRVKVSQSPRVAVLSTGNEVVSPGEPLGPGQIYDSNRTTLTAALREQGFTPVDLGVARDSRESLVSLLTRGLEDGDVLVTSGGVSMGEKDLLKPVLEEDFGATIHFGRVFMEPGKPTTFATVERGGKTKLVFALPGNPVSSIVTFYLFVLPALRKMAGWKKPQSTIISAKLSHSISLDPRPEYHRAFLSWGNDGTPTVSSTGSQCSSRLLSMRTANVLLVLPPRTELQTTLEAGTTIRAMIIGPLV